MNTFKLYQNLCLLILQGPREQFITHSVVFGPSGLSYPLVRAVDALDVWIHKAASGGAHFPQSQASWRACKRTLTFHRTCHFKAILGHKARLTCCLGSFRSKSCRWEPLWAVKRERILAAWHSALIFQLYQKQSKGIIFSILKSHQTFQTSCFEILDICNG